VSISIGSAVGAGFNLIGRRPLSVIAWGFFLYFTIVLLFALSVVVIGFSVFGKLQQLNGMTDPTQVSQTLLQVLLAMWPALVIVSIGALLIGAVVQGAVYRAILMPEDKGLFSLRLGGREMALVLLSLLVFVVVIVVYALSIVLIGVLAYVAARIGSSVGPLLLVLFCIFYALAMMWLALRFAMAGPMTFAEGRVRFFGSWALTRGNGWSLFGLAWVMLLVLIGITIASAIIGGIVNIVFGGGVSALLMGSSGASSSPDAAAQFAAHWPMLLLAAVPSLVLNAVMQGLTQAIFQGPWVDVYRQLRGAPDVSHAFT
jgi:hypothetical protein